MADNYIGKADFPIFKFYLAEWIEDNLSDSRAFFSDMRHRAIMGVLHSKRVDISRKKYEMMCDTVACLESEIAFSDFSVLMG